MLKRMLNKPMTWGSYWKVSWICAGIGIIIALVNLWYIGTFSDMWDRHVRRKKELEKAKSEAV